MDKLNQLLGSLEKVMADNDLDSKEKLNSTINRIAGFYIEQYKIKKDEIALFLINPTKTALYFVYPRYLVGSDDIAINSEKAIVSQVFRTGKSILDNEFLEKDRLIQYEFIKTDEDESKMIWKSIISILPAWGEKIGVIQVSRKRSAYSDVGEDFTEQDLNFLETSIEQLGAYIKTFMYK